MEKRIQRGLKKRFNLYNSKREIVLECVSMTQIAKYLKYKNMNAIRGYVLLGKKDLKNQLTKEMFYFEPIKTE